MTMTAGLAVLAFVLLLKISQAPANDWANDLTTCRLVKCMVGQDARGLRLSRGAQHARNLVLQVWRMEATRVSVPVV